jgi:hypothetical protein
MGTKRRRDLAVRLEGVRRRFEDWRRRRKARSRIPEPLWAAAVKMAGRYGVCRTARALGVDYYSLKRRVDREGAADGNGPPRKRLVGTASSRSKTSRVASEAAAGATFLELTPPARVGSCRWTLEFESAGGAKMRLEFQGVESPDLAALGRSFWRMEP